MHVADPKSGQVTLSGPGGANVVTGTADGLLHAQSGGTAASQPGATMFAGEKIALGPIRAAGPIL